MSGRQRACINRSQLRDVGATEGVIDLLIAKGTLRRMHRGHHPTQVAVLIAQALENARRG